MVNSINKGKNGEREFCVWLEKNFHLPERPKRNLEQTREGGYDIYVKPFLFEVKRVEKLERDKWWKQVVKASEQIEDSVPVVAYRKNRHKWKFLVSLEHLDCGIYNEGCIDFFNLINSYLELKAADFIPWAKTFLPYHIE